MSTCPLGREPFSRGHARRARAHAAPLAGGLPCRGLAKAALARRLRSDRGTPADASKLQLLIEGVALRRPPPALAMMHRQVAGVAREQGWPVPGFAAVYDVVRSVDPAMAALARDGSRRVRHPAGAA